MRWERSATRVNVTIIPKLTSPSIQWRGEAGVEMSHCKYNCSRNTFCWMFHRRMGFQFMFYDPCFVLTTGSWCLSPPSSSTQLLRSAWRQWTTYVNIAHLLVWDWWTHLKKKIHYISSYIFDLESIWWWNCKGIFEKSKSCSLEFQWKTGSGWTEWKCKKKW